MTLTFDQISAIAWLSLLSVAACLMGVALAFFFKQSRKKFSIALGFSTGIMLLISFLELMPEAAEMIGWLPALFSMFLGLALIAGINRLVPHHHFPEEAGWEMIPLKTAYLLALGLILHDLPEGLAMAEGYLAEPKLGIMVGASIALHNIPEELMLSVPLVASGKFRSLWFLLFFSALAEPVGAFFGLISVSILPGLLPNFLAITAGVMAWICVHELTPLAKKNRRMADFFLGVGMGLVAYLSLRLIVSLGLVC